LKGFVGFVDDAGNFSLDDRRAFMDYAAKLKGEIVVLTIKKQDKRQGNQSMRYYRGVVIPDLATACGYTEPDEWKDVHDGMAWKFLRIADGPFGQPRRRSTAKTDMSQEEMTAYIEQVITYGETSVPGCRIRRPHEVDLETVWAPDYDAEAA
jgi:hypothetical protein